MPDSDGVTDPVAVDVRDGVAVRVEMPDAVAVRVEAAVRVGDGGAGLGGRARRDAPCATACASRVSVRRRRSACASALRSASSWAESTR